MKKNYLIRPTVVKSTKKGILFDGAFDTNRGIHSYYFWVPKSRIEWDGLFLKLPWWLYEEINALVKTTNILGYAKLIQG